LTFIFSVFIKAVLAGICIGIGGTVFLSCDSKMLGAFLFALGLFAILTRGYKLFTGAVGYFWEKNARFKLEVIIIWAGNLAGTFAAGTVLGLTRIHSISEKAVSLVDTKLADTPLSIFILAVFCGMLMYIAVHGWNSAVEAENKTGVGNSAVKVVACVLPVAVFILCGFEHCIANMYYFALAGVFPFTDTWQYLAIMTAGNAVGAWILSVPMYLMEKAPKSAEKSA
jgi:formate/nitrite transporter FocA (FNT family)